MGKSVLGYLEHDVQMTEIEIEPTFDVLGLGPSFVDLLRPRPYRAVAGDSLRGWACERRVSLDFGGPTAQQLELVQ